MKKNKDEKVIDVIEKNYPSVVLGLDISTACIGISIVYDDGENEPEIVKITHVVPKIDKDKEGIEALILRKEIFEKEFLMNIVDCGITECVIEAPLIFASGNSNANTVAQLLKFNALLSEAVYRVLGIVPYYISSSDARMYAFPKLLTVRKFNRKGEAYPYNKLEKSVKDSNLTLFGSYPFDCDKKSIMMNLVMEKYKDINWIYNKKGELKKENFDACDSLVCALAYINKKRYGEIEQKIENSIIEKSNEDNKAVITYTVKPWKDAEGIEHKLTSEL